METTNLEQLTVLVEQMANAVIATSETVEQLSICLEDLTGQIKQQGYQIFAISETMQSLIDSQTQSQRQINQLTTQLTQLVKILETTSLNEQI